MLFAHSTLLAEAGRFEIGSLLEPASEARDHGLAEVGYDWSRFLRRGVPPRFSFDSRKQLLCLLRLLLNERLQIVCRLPEALDMGAGELVIGVLNVQRFGWAEA